MKLVIKTSKLTILICIVGLGLVTQNAFAQIELEIVTYGDSITAGLIRTINDNTSAECAPGVSLAPSLSGSGNLRCFGFGDEGVGGYQPSLKESIEPLFYDLDIYNYGSSGIETGQLSSELNGVLSSESDASYVLLMGGTNDAFDFDSSSSVKFNLESMVDKVCAQGMTPVLATIPKVLGAFNDPVNDNVKDYNDDIRNNISAPGGCTLIKAEQYDTLKVSSSNYGPDDVHLSTAGNILMASVWFDALALEDMTPPPPPDVSYISAIIVLILGDDEEPPAP